MAWQRWHFVMLVLLMTLVAGLAVACTDDHDDHHEANLVDEDRDGFDILVDCNDQDANVHPDATEVAYNGIDDDCDPMTSDNDVDGDGASHLVDCADDDPSRFPGAAEIAYDGVDQDCKNGDLVDVDRDGAVAAVAGGDDCDDNNPTVRPSAPEVCGDTVDQDCSGDDLPCTTSDVDEDGFSVLQGDCNDLDPTINPDAVELTYTGVDEDCDLTTPDDDLDGDGFFKKGGGDCDDTDAAIFPGADEVAYDSIDQDCSGSDLTDVDRDGAAAESTGGTDCDDHNPYVHTAGVDVCGDGVDQDCSGADLLCSDVDGDGDGYTTNDGDCDDANPAQNPGATEVAYNGVDEDCDPATRDDDLDFDGFTVNGGGDCDDTQSLVHPGAQESAYDGVDQDCSGADLVDIDRDGFNGTTVGGNDCNDIRPDISPASVEIPFDSVDQDCDGSDWVGTPSVVAAGNADQIAPDVAFGTADYLVVWEEHSGTTNAIRAQRVGTDGVPIGPPQDVYSVTAPANLFGPKVAFDGSSYLVVWTSDMSVDYDVVGRFVAASGVPSGGTINIFSGAATQRLPAVAFAGTEFLVTAVENPGAGNELRGRFVTTSGTVSGNLLIAAPYSAAFATSIIGVGADYWVAYQVSGADGSADVAAAKVMANRTLGVTTLVSTRAGDQGVPDITYDGTELMTVFSSGSAEIVGQIMDIAGTLLFSTSDQNLLVSKAPVGRRSPQVVEAGGVFFPVWLDGRWLSVDASIYGQAVQIDGTLVATGAAENVPILAHSDAPQELAVAANTLAGSMLVVWSYQTGGGRDIAALRYTP